MAITLLIGIIQAQERLPINDPREEMRGLTKSPLEHIINYIDEPFSVRKVNGTILSAGGQWPDSVEIFFEIRGPDGSNKIKRAKVSKNGEFVMGRISSGKYVFKATAFGWQSVVGTINVNPKADPQKTISIVMPLGV